MTRNKLTFTGERALPFHHNSDMYKISWSRYKFVAKYLKKNYEILDIACGSGYGSAYLAKKAKKVIGCDIDKETVGYCISKYKDIKNLIFEVADSQIFDEKFANKFNLIVSLETIEHLDDHLKYLKNLYKYTKPGGIIIISTPNNYNKIHPPANNFHTREFEIRDLFGILNKSFPEATISVFGMTKTNSRRDDHQKKINYIKTFLSIFINRIYVLDKKLFNLAPRFEHLQIYKKIGGIQRDYKISSKIYKINLDSNYYNPTNSIFVIHLKDKKR